MRATMTRILNVCATAIALLVSLLVYKFLTHPDDGSANWSRFQNSLEASETRGNMIVSQLERFRAERERYPSRLDELVPD